VISVPQVPEDRYYVLQFIDLFTYNCAYIGSRATGNGSGNFLFVGPSWQGEIPEGFKKVFRCETEIVGILGRTQLNGPDDIENVRKVQAGFRITPLSAFENQLAAIDAGVKDAQATLDVTLSSNGLFGSRDALGEDYLTRCAGAAKGQYGNSLEEAWYDWLCSDQRRPAVIPPPTTRAWPVTKLDSLLASQSAAFAISAGNPDLPIGYRSAIHGSTISGVRSTNSVGRSGTAGAKIAVAIPPGQIALTRMPRSASSKAADFVNPTTPNFAAE